MSTSTVTLYDTTLRDGAQGEGIHFSLADKLRIAQRLDAFGMHYIEGGWPGSNEKDVEFFREAKKLKFRNAKLAAFGSTRRAKSEKGEPAPTGVEAGMELAANDPQVRLLVDAQTPVVTLVCKASALHVKEILKTTFGENRGMIRDTIRYLVSQNREVIFDGEHTFDGYKLDSPTTLSSAISRQRSQAQIISCCATPTAAPCRTRSRRSLVKSQHF